MKKVVIAEAGAASNIGSMALILNAIEIAQKIYPNCEITVLTPDILNVVKELKRHYSKNINVINDLLVFPRSKNMLHKILWLINSIFFLLWCNFIVCFTKNPFVCIMSRKRKVLKSVSEADLILCIGAERINDVYYKTALLSLLILTIYERMQKRVVHFSLTIGPVFNKLTILLAKHVLNNSYAIFVRDTKSYSLLKEWGISHPSIFNSFDIALLQKKCSDEEALLVLKKYGINLNQPIVGVSVINWAFRKVKGPQRMDDYNLAFSLILDYIIENYGCQILFTPTVVGGAGIDDVQQSETIKSKMKNKKETFIVRELLSPDILAGVYSKCRYSIVTRMHAAILCSGAGCKNIISVNYLYKLREYMKNIGFEDYSVDIDYVNFDSLKGFVDNMETNYELNSSVLSNRVAILKERLQMDIESLLKL